MASTTKMMRPARVESSATNIAVEGFRLSLLLNAAACQIAQSGIEIHSIAKGVSVFSLALKQLNQVLQAPDSNPSQEAVDKTLEIACQGERILIEIERMLDKLKGTDTHETLKTLPLQQRVKWCFKKHHVTYLLAQLESLKLSLMVILQVLQLGRHVNNTKGTPVDDAISQEKAEAQNMFIVRYWATKRLNRLWELVEQETLEAESDPTNQLINSHYLFISKTPQSWTRSTKLPVPAFGDGDEGISAIERSPKDMVQLSEQIINQFLSIWVIDVDPSSSSAESNTQRPRRVHFSSDSDDSNDSSFAGHDIRGYYLEGPTDDWRQPHSQDARYHAACLRKKYSKYQARVESDSEDSESPKHRRSSNTDDDSALGFSDEGSSKRQSSQRSQKPTTNVNNAPSPRGSPHSFNSRQPSFKPQHPHPYAPSHAPPSSRRPYLKPPSPHSSQPPPPQQQDYGIPRSTPVRIPSSAPPYTHPPSQFDTHGQASPRLNNLQTQHLSPAHSFSPTHSYSSDTSRSHHSRKRPSRENSTRDRRKSSFTGRATKGLIGAGAIAGFMDALEAFSV
ncbi:hypothetical protein PHISCL_06426 [Aspergillus sclerotialis]|uniref:Fungal N-terminal domain-containing protein n=1 Tax=Aspergillus sclerotialis TaxID=2070753 RepID=A0A3A2ZPD5_9EURO|nr:hypothetical protein PHISCL_06426 [Aspergillus sclerotialis]